MADALVEAKKNKHSSTEGISIIEILVVIAILGVSLASLLSLINFSLKASTLSKETTEADVLAREALEAVRNFRDGTTWDTTGLGILTTGTAYHPQKTGDSPPKWTMSAGEETIGIFKRKIVFERVYRDANDNIAVSGTEDADTKKAIVTVSWQERGRSHSFDLIAYFTNWR